MSILKKLTTDWNKIINRWGRIVDSVFKYIPQPIAQTTEKILSKETGDQISQSFADIKETFSDLFAEIKEEDSINLAEEDIPCAIIANIVYDTPDSRPNTIDQYTLIKSYNQIDYCLYRDNKKGKLIIWYRWTNFTDTKDYISDINIVIGTHIFNERFQEAMKVYEEIVALYPDDIKVITWHSLGWTICYMIAQVKDPDRTVAFNPWSSANPTFIMMMKDTQFQAPWTKRVFTYRILWDIVSTLSVIWYTRTFRKASVNPRELHAMINFVPSKKE